MVPHYKVLDAVVDTLLKSNAHSAIKFLDPKLRVKATRQLVHGKIPSRGAVDIRIQIGRPNYLERKFVKDCLKAGVKFPVKKIWLRPVPKRKDQR